MPCRFPACHRDCQLNHNHNHAVTIDHNNRNNRNNYRNSNSSSDGSINSIGNIGSNGRLVDSDLNSSSRVPAARTHDATHLDW
jgi:hypothetical protein